MGLSNSLWNMVILFFAKAWKKAWSLKPKAWSLNFKFGPRPEPDPSLKIQSPKGLKLEKIWPDPPLINRCDVLKTVLDWLNVIVTLSGQNWLWPQIYPKVVVYPSGVCTYDKGSFGAPWWSPGTPPKTPLFSVINLCPSLPHPGGIFGWSI